jgi:hypothetical protein
VHVVYAISSATERIIVALGVFCDVGREVFGTFLASWWWLWQVEMK